jgi:predicted lipid-binding transport protein (Tim44 family)
MDRIGSTGTGYQSIQNAPAPKAAAETRAAEPKDSVSIGSGKSGAIEKVFSTLTSGVGLASGAIGGGMLGAAVGSTGSLLTGLLAKSVTLAALTSAGLTGGIAGAAIFGIAGAYGGWKLTDMAADAISWAKNKFSGQ